MYDRSQDRKLEETAKIQIATAAPLSEMYSCAYQFVFLFLIIGRIGLASVPLILFE